MSDLLWYALLKRSKTGRSYRSLSLKYHVGFGTLRRNYNSLINTGHLAVQRNRGRHHSLTKDELNILDHYVFLNDDRYLFEIRDFIQQEIGKYVSLSTTARYLKMLGYRRKKIKHRAKEASTSNIAEFITIIEKFKIEHFVWLDECYTEDRTRLRLYGWAKSGAFQVKDFI